MDREDDETKYAPKAPEAFLRGPNQLQHWIQVGGAHAPAKGRYHLFINYGCGWSHQVMLLRALKGLEDVVSMSHLGVKRIGRMRTPEYRGWFVPEDPTGNGFCSAFGIYNSNHEYGSSQLTIPILFDRELKKVVSNDPAQILLMLNSAFEEWAPTAVDFYPPGLQGEIEDMNGVVFPGINDGVYRCWLGGSDEAYQEGFAGLQAALSFVESRLQKSSFLCGEELTLADVRAFPHLFRFDVIYHKMMLREPRGPLLMDNCPATVRWLQRLFEIPAIQQTCDLEVATRFYFPASMPDEECDDIYAKAKYSWMPLGAELETKRRAEELPEASARKDVDC